MLLLKHVDLSLSGITGIKVVLVLADTCIEVEGAVFCQDPINNLGELLV